MNEALLWTDGRYFLQATQELSDEWRLMRIGEDPAVEVWMADVSPSWFLLLMYILFSCFNNFSSIVRLSGVYETEICFYVL